MLNLKQNSISNISEKQKPIKENKHSIDLGDTEPMQNIGHECLEAHILDPGDVFRAFEVFACAIGAAFSCIVYKIFCDLPPLVLFFPTTL